MSLSEKLVLGINTTVIGMGIVFLVLYLLSLIIKAESKLFKRVFPDTEKTSRDAIVSPMYTKQETSISDGSNGAASGKMVLGGVKDNKTAAIILAAVSADSGIPLSSLAIKSVRKVRN